MPALRDTETNDIYFCFQRAQSQAEKRDMQTNRSNPDAKYFSRRPYGVHWRLEGDSGHYPTWDGLGTDKSGSLLRGSHYAEAPLGKRSRFLDGHDGRGHSSRENSRYKGLAASHSLRTPRSHCRPFAAAGAWRGKGVA